MANRDDDDRRGTRSLEQAAADTREPTEATRLRAEDDDDTRRRQDRTEEGLRAAADSLEDNREGLRESRGALSARERELERTSELARDVAEGAADLRDETAEAARQVHDVPTPRVDGDGDPGRT
jgi:hypothetical protein